MTWVVVMTATPALPENSRIHIQANSPDHNGDNSEQATEIRIRLAKNLWAESRPESGSRAEPAFVDRDLRFVRSRVASVSVPAAAYGTSYVIFKVVARELTRIGNAKAEEGLPTNGHQIE